MIGIRPRTLITIGSVAASVLVAAPALADGDHGMLHGGNLGPGTMDEMGAGMMDAMADWLAGETPGERPGTGTEGTAGPRMLRMPMGPRMDRPETPAMPQMPGAEGAPGMMAPGFRLQMAPGWSG